MRRIALCGLALLLFFSFFSLPAHADDLTVLAVDSYLQNGSPKALGGGQYRFEFYLKVKNTGKVPLSGVCGMVGKKTSSSPGLQVLDPKVCFAELPPGGTLQSAGVFALRYTSKTLPNNWQSLLKWTFTSISITAQPSVLTIQQGTLHNGLSFFVTLSTSASKPYHVTFSQTNPAGFTVTGGASGWETSTNATWLVAEEVQGTTSGSITVSASIPETTQTASLTVPVSVTSSPPPPQLGTLGSWPDALQVGVEATVRFSIAVSGSSLSGNLTLEQQTGGTWQPIATLTDSGPPGDIQAGDAIYGGTASFTPVSEGTLVFRAVSSTGESVPYALTVISSSFPIGAAPTDFQKVITTPSGQKVVGNRLLVRFQPGTGSDTISAILNPISGTVVGFLGAINYYHVEIPTADKDTLFADLLALRASPYVFAAQPDFVGQEATAPDDQYYVYKDTTDPGQWGMRVIGAEGAWSPSFANQGQGMKVAVIDSGVDPTHKEFLYTDSTKPAGLDSRVKPCIPTTDGSGNNVIYCPTCTITLNSGIYGLDCSADTNPNFDKDGAGLLSHMKDDGHGTQVAGIIGAAGNNTQGIAGMAWNSDILAVKACTFGSCPTSAVADAVTAARGLNAKVINLSLWTATETYVPAAGTTPAHCDPPVFLTQKESDDDKAVQLAVEKASADALIVVAAGNYANGEIQNTCKTYPAAHPKALAVGAVKRNPDEFTLAIKDNSRRGDWVHLAAPGETIWTLGSNAFGGTFTFGEDTSIAAPHVSGAAALLWAKHPLWSSNTIRSRLLLSAQQPNTLPVSYGLLDAFALMGALDPGNPDTSFGNGGVVTHNNAAGGNGHDYGHSITLDSSGRILVTGSSTNAAGNLDMAIWRYNSNGTLDTSFGGTGYVVHSNAAGGNGDDSGQSITLDSSDRILVSGWSRNTGGSYDMAIWRYNSNGTIDLGFGGTGYVVHNNAAGGNGYDVGLSLALDSSGRILVTGYSYTDAAASYDMAIWRYNSNGTIDLGFGGTGYVVHNNAAGGNGGDFGFSMVLDRCGLSCGSSQDSYRILATGYSMNADSNSDMAIWRYLDSGTLDTAFGGTGYVVHNSAAGGNWDDSGHSIALDSSGRILVTGSSYNNTSWNIGPLDMAIWRYNSNGTLDTTFGGTGYVAHNNAGGGNTTDYGYSIALDSSGRILVTGYSMNAAGNADMVIWRYLPDGALDPTFGNGGVVVSGNAAGGNGDDYGISIAFDPSGRVLVSGSSLNAAGDFDMTIWRYLP
jgi:uncharacterized delta-60 repeat protein